MASKNWAAQKGEKGKKKKLQWQHVEIPAQNLMNFAEGGFISLEECDAEVLDIDALLKKKKRKRNRGNDEETDNSESVPPVKKRRQEKSTAQQGDDDNLSDIAMTDADDENEGGTQKNKQKPKNSQKAESVSNSGAPKKTTPQKVEGEKSSSVQKVKEVRKSNGDSSNPEQEEKTPSKPKTKEEEQKEKELRKASRKKKKEKQKKRKQGRKKAQEAKKKEEAAKAAAAAGPSEPLDMSPWKALELHPLLIQGLEDLKFAVPTDIQKQTLPPALSWRKDIIGAAETGSGKTLAFGLPILHQLMVLKEKGKIPDSTSEEKKLSCLICTPTRELAMQIVDHLRAVAKHTSISIVPVVGGIAIPKQERFLSHKPDIIVATPGRFWELMNQMQLYLNNLDDLRFLVIDEADRMIEKGHFQELLNILQVIQRNDPVQEEDEEEEEGDEEEEEGEEPEEDALDVLNEDDGKKRFPRQTLVFSATLALSEEGRKKYSQRRKKKIMPQTKKNKSNEPESTLDHLLDTINFQRKVEIVNVKSLKATATNLKESKIQCLLEEKDLYLYYFLLKYPGRTLVFVNSISCVRRLVPLLTTLRVPAWAMHAQMQQRQRLKNLDRFKVSTNSVLVATDVLARGVDITNVDHVVHYQVPRTAEIYIHRSGRTARAQNTGLSLLLVSPPELNSYKTICNVLNKEAGATKLNEGLPDFPIDQSLIVPLTKRIQAALLYNEELHSQQKETSNNNWYLKQAEALDIELDETIQKELGSKDSYEKKKESIKLAKLKAELNVLLKKSIVPQGSSVRYYSRNYFVPLDSGEVKHNAIDDLQAKKEANKAAALLKLANIAKYSKGGVKANDTIVKDEGEDKTEGDEEGEGGDEVEGDEEGDEEGDDENGESTGDFTSEGDIDGEGESGDGDDADEDDD